MGHSNNKVFTYLSYFFYVLFILLIGYFVYVNFFSAKNEDLAYIFTSIYCSIALVGGTLGIFCSSLWGGNSSRIGSGLTYLSLGLISQFIFQISYTFYYFVLGIENPYPSVGDLFYVLGNLFFLLGIIKLFTVLYRQNNVSISNTILSLLLAFALITTYVLLYIKYVYSPSVFEINSSESIIVLFIDSITLLINIAMFYLLTTSMVTSIKYMGGVLRTPVLILLTSVLLFYIADIEYTLSDALGRWKPAGIDDLLLFLAYSAVGYGVIKFKKAYEKLA